MKLKVLELSKRSLELSVAVLFVMSIAVFGLPVSVSAFEDGDGTEETPYRIGDCQQLQDMQDDLDAYYVLANDIDCSETTEWNSGDGFVPVGDNANPFLGELDGDYHTISNLHINRDDWEVGLFGRVGQWDNQVGLVTKVGMEDVDITGDWSTGGIVGVLYGQVNTSYTTGEVNGSGETGGLVGSHGGVWDTVIDSWSSADVTGGELVGGMFGEMENDEGGSLTLSKAYATASVTGTCDDGYSNYGGLIGDLEAFAEDDEVIATTTLEDVYAWGDVSGNESAGGLIGDMEAYNDDYEDSVASITIRRAYASGDVEATAYDAGGFAGNIEELYYEGESITIEDSFAAGTVVAESDAGGFAGIIDEGDIAVEFDNNYFDTNNDTLDCSDDGDVDECTGINESAQTDYFKNNTASAPLNQWDFDEVWLTTAAYPVLRGMQNSGSASLTSAENGSPITLAQTGCAAITNTSTEKESALSIKDAGFDYPLGFVGFSLIGCGTGGTATITVTFTGSFNPSSVVARKYNPNSNAFTTINGAVLEKTTLNSNEALQITYTITDGGELDMDGTVNGTIVDPVGLGSQAISAPNTGLNREQ